MGRLFHFVLCFASSLNGFSLAIRDETVHFDIELSHGDVDPIGTGPSRAILVNSSFVGPPLLLKVGQNVEFGVRNNLREDTTIHFHGISQAQTPWADGTPGLSQSPIRPGASYLYRWTADEPGVYFYHAHNRGQIMDDLYGAIVIEPSPEAERPFHFVSNDPVEQEAMRQAEKRSNPLLLSDWTQYSFSEFYGIEQKANLEGVLQRSWMLQFVCSYAMRPYAASKVKDFLVEDSVQERAQEIVRNCQISNRCRKANLKN